MYANNQCIHLDTTHDIHMPSSLFYSCRVQVGDGGSDDGDDSERQSRLKGFVAHGDEGKEVEAEDHVSERTKVKVRNVAMNHLCMNMFRLDLSYSSTWNDVYVCTPSCYVTIR